MVNRFIDALLGSHEILMTNVLSACMGRVFETSPCSNSPAEILVSNIGRRKEFKGEENRCFLRHRMGHYAKDCRSKSKIILRIV